MNACAIYRDVSFGVLARFFLFFSFLTAELMASKQGLDCASADGWECFELRGPCRHCVPVISDSSLRGSFLPQTAA